MDALTDIVRDKTFTHLDSEDTQTDFIPYIAQRFLSIIDPSIAHLLNQTSNRWMDSMDKQEIYKLWCLIVPKMDMNRFKYIKKNRRIYSEEEKQAIALLAVEKECSFRDIIEYVEQFDLDINKIARIARQ